VEEENVQQKELNVKEFQNVEELSQNVLDLKQKEQKIVFVKLENVVNSLEVVLVKNVTTKNFSAKIIKNVKLFVIKKLLKDVKNGVKLKQKLSLVELENVSEF